MTPFVNHLPNAGSTILGLGSHRGSRVVDNAEISDRLDVPEKWIVARSGIRSRRWASDQESVTAMGTAAAQAALESSGVNPSDVGCVIVATITHLRQTPAAAPSIAAAIGAIGAGAFDISAACSGFCYGLALADNIVRSGSSRYVLVVAVERISDMLDLDDPATAFLFADGAGAVVVGPSSEAGVGPVVWGSDGSRQFIISQTDTWDKTRTERDGPWPGRLQMSGTALYRWVIQEMAPVAQQALTLAGVKATELDAFIPHQANGRIITSLAKALGLPDNVVVAFDVAEQGNTSAASVPLAMHAMLQRGEAKPGGLALLLGFGAGLAYAAQVVRLPERFAA